MTTIAKDKCFTCFNFENCFPAICKFAPQTSIAIIPKSWISIKGVFMTEKTRQPLQRSFLLAWINLKPRQCKITQCLCSRFKAGSVRSQLLAHRSAVFQWCSRRREPGRKFWLPMRTAETALLSTKEKEGCHVTCDELKEPWSSRVSIPPKQTSKNKQLHPTEKEMGQRD